MITKFKIKDTHTLREHLGLIISVRCRYKQSYETAFTYFPRIDFAICFRFLVFLTYTCYQTSPNVSKVECFLQVYVITVLAANLLLLTFLSEGY